VRTLHSVATHPEPDVAERRAERNRFLGENLSPDPLSGGPWLVHAVLGGAQPLEITRDGVIPWRFDGVLPLRHGFSRTGAAASCLLEAPGLQQLRADPSAGSRAAIEVECAACRAWQVAQAGAPRRASPVMARLRAALEELVPGRAA